jgi:Protein of unknown function (DUF1579)
MRLSLVLLLALAACVSSASGTRPADPIAPPPAVSSACTAPEFHQLDFWLGKWDLVLHARKLPGLDEWTDARGTQVIESILGGCAIAESFAADGPEGAWAGRSYSSWQPKLGKWRQTWVDDQGSYLAFTGGLEDGTMTLYGEPRLGPDGNEVRMRMVWLNVTPDRLEWQWQRSADQGKSWSPVLRIDYHRRK